MPFYHYVILGGGMVAGYAAQEFVQLGLKPQELALVSADNHLPYERPPLSKSFLAGQKREEEILINDVQFYRQHGITVYLHTTVSGVDFKKRQLLSSGETIGFEKLLIATGGVPRMLRVPGASLEGIHYLRLLDDALRLRERYQTARRAVVIGAGFIGMEVAAVLTQQNLEVTLVYPGERVWPHFFTPEMSAMFEKYYASRGVHLRPGRHVIAFQGGERLDAVKLDSREELPADLAVVGIGVEPAIEPFAGGGLEIDNGILVNEFLETSLGDVYAAGDVANYQDMIFARRRRFEHWDNAVEQGRHAARVMCGQHQPFVHVPYFFSDVFDLSYEVWGDASHSDRVVYRGDVASTSFSTWWFLEGRPVAVFALNRPDEERQLAQEWIQKRIQLPIHAVQDESRALGSLEI